MAQAFENVRNKRNGAAREAVRARANDVMEDFAELRKDVGRLADAAGKAARVEMKHTGTRLGSIRSELGARAQDGASYVTEQVRARPAAAVGVSLGAGLLLGLLLSARRH
ncbi:MAG: hypothetical protein J0L81_00285 [Caulobacterales bacterium]|jgi:ElaB/YqjD/DUF883 family membrane-anchored ribosome-binding protein|nr:hypothetical protein [Caulobacterales bacterium]